MNGYYINEDAIEQSILDRLHDNYHYDILRLDPSMDAFEKDDKTGRDSKSECVLKDILRSSLYRLNPNVDKEALNQLVTEAAFDYTGTDIADKNREFYGYLREGRKITVRKGDKDDFEIVRYIDFDNPNNNTFTAINQMWIQGTIHNRRPDVILFVNGLPLVFIELKDSTHKVSEAYDKNLTNYKHDICNLFAWNQICVLSNGIETRLGAWNAGYEYFFEWWKEKESDVINREAGSQYALSVTKLIDGLFKPETLLDYIENFILFDNGNKIIAKNHQYLGVNNLMDSLAHREEKNGKLGVFWHTQGSGKSYSMVFFVRKVKRKVPGNWTFLVVTDREDLDTQIHKTFVRTEVIGKKDECQPKNAKQLREYLEGNKPMVFTLIHKFNYDKTQRYPLLTRRNDIIVLVDEAHRTQYKQLAENMHTGIPNANYIAFTGTPLLGAKRLTNQWFGDYVSEYNFAQAIADGSTVPLYYSRRVPEVNLGAECLNDDVTEICETENLNERERMLLENSASCIIEVIKRDDRLEKIAQDIARHFPERGFRGKGMVVSVDKYTAVRMYDKVQHYWKEELKRHTLLRNNATTEEERDKQKSIIDYMKSIQMAVVISEEADEVERFTKQGLDISKHRAEINRIDPEGLDIEDRFKSPDNPLSLVFVCAMWLTGFDVPSLSTLYLDKPMKGHTLMQAIARANRVFPGKQNGIIVDYVNVFKYMQQALVDYASPSGDGEYPAKDINALIQYIDDTIHEIDTYLIGLGFNLSEQLKEKGDNLDWLEYLRTIYNFIITKDDIKERYKVMSNLLMNLHDAAQPEIIEMDWHHPLYKSLKTIHGYLTGDINDEKLNRARLRMQALLDENITAAETSSQVQYAIHQGKVIDLSKLDLEQIRTEIHESEYKAIAVENLRDYIDQMLERMIKKNKTRQKFAERFRAIVDQYNAGGTENEEYYEKLLQFISELQAEQSRANTEGLTDEELEIYDMLIEDRKLTKEEVVKVKLAAKALYTKLLENKASIFVVDWYKDASEKQKVIRVISTTLDAELPNSYTREIFNQKTNLLLNHFADMSIQGYGWLAS